MDGVDKFKEFIHLHGNQLLQSDVPQHFWHTLSRKLEQQLFDAGNAFQLLMIDYDEGEKGAEDPLYTLVVTKPEGIKATNSQEIYIVDHAWTYRLQNARSQLQQIPALLDRLANMMGASHLDREDAVEYVMKEMWRYNQMYALRATNGAEVAIEDRMPIWYIMDEIGTAVNHSDSPNFRLVPFMHLTEGITYSLLFPVKDTSKGERVTRDFAEGNTTDSIRKALLLPWCYTNFTDIDFEQIEPDSKYFLDGHIEETLPIESANNPTVDSSRPLRVYTTYSMVQQHLNDPLFQVVDNEQEADILWLTTHFKTYKEFSEHAPNKFINQFPFENVITIKDLLSIVCRRTASTYCDKETLQTFPKWLPTTFNLKTELPQFVSYYQTRDEKELDNHWIIKPWNLARGLDTYISKDVEQIVRLQPTGPKIAQKYIENAVLFDRADIGAKVKFDVRYVFLVKNTEPLEAYIYKKFFLRFANKPFSLDQFDEYEKHFTVMNYGSNLQLLHLPCADFLKLWN
ncbi:tubulin--tyrosine ligase-like protein 12, partial [Contarinia nasturtii]|uniref:tubulin--tyrosine ligase-like protein 12 n=1 Tax=Contarinia nasturtii TaxID=265458 RepID=UPI0012D3D6B9